MMNGYSPIHHVHVQAILRGNIVKCFEWPLVVHCLIDQTRDFVCVCVSLSFPGRSVRFADMPPAAPRGDGKKKKRLVKKTKAITPLQAMMLRMAGMLPP